MTAEAERQAQLLRGSLDMCLLALLDDAPTHAYDLVVRLAERGLPGVGYGTIYPLVGRLRRLGLLEGSVQASPAGPPRKVFALSPAGRAALADRVRQWLAHHVGRPGLLHASGAVPDREEQRT